MLNIDFTKLDLKDLASYNDIITSALEEIEMRKRKEILDNHKFAIKQIVEKDKKGGDVIVWMLLMNYSQVMTQ